MLFRLLSRRSDARGSSAKIVMSTNINSSTIRSDQLIMVPLFTLDTGIYQNVPVSIRLHNYSQKKHTVLRESEWIHKTKIFMPIFLVLDSLPRSYCCHVCSSSHFVFDVNPSHGRTTIMTSFFGIARRGSGFSARKDDVHTFLYFPTVALMLFKIQIFFAAGVYIV